MLNEIKYVTDIYLKILLNMKIILAALFATAALSHNHGGARHGGHKEWKNHKFTTCVPAS
jgi:hypothetical protein